MQSEDKPYYSARAESIRKARTDSFLPITKPKRNSLEANKIDHYAALGVVMRESFEQFTANETTLANLYSASSVANLSRQLTDTIIEQTLAVVHSEAFSTIHSELDQSQSARSHITEGLWDRIEENLEAGANTFVNTAEALYEVLEAQASVSAAESPANAQLLDRLAKLNIAPFTVFRDVYLETSANQSAFMELVEPYDDGYHFKPHMPLDAPVPEMLAYMSRIRMTHDLRLENNPLTALSNIPDFGTTLGCPITFYNGQVTELWNIYVSSRRALRQRKSLGKSIFYAANSGDNEA